MNNKKTYELILLDWDGCVADTLSIWMTGYKKIFAEYGLFPTEREIGEKAFGDWESPKKFGIEDSDTYTKKLLEFTDKELLKVQFNPNVKATLEQLKISGKKLAILTSSRKINVVPAIERLGIGPTVDLLLAKEDVIKFKPDPEIIDKAVSYFKIPKESTIIVGDSEKDIFAGKNAGIDTLLYFPQSNDVYYDEKKLRELKADYFIHNFEELFSIVQ